MSPMDSLTLHALLWWACTVLPALIAVTAAARVRKRRDRQQQAHPDGCTCGPCREWAAVLSVIEGSGP